MIYPFDHSRKRYASLGVFEILPEPLIESIWLTIDDYLKGAIPLSNLLKIQLINTKGYVTIQFSQDTIPITLAIDLPISYLQSFPNEIYAFDDGDRETILLPSEIMIL